MGNNAKHLLIFLLVLAIFVISVTLGVQNDQQVTFNYLLMRGEYRISTLLAILFAAGFATGQLTCDLLQLRVRVSLARAKRKIKRLKNQLSPATDVTATPHSSASKEQLSMPELLFLLLPVTAAYGWYMGRRSAQQNKQDEADHLSRDYVAGVNSLPSNQRNRAIDLPLDVFKEDIDAVETCLTLGNLFRSRGEVDRAIRIHQILIESASLTYEQRLLAIQQLRRNYMAAGLYSRTEDMFNQLTNEADFRIGALQQLLQIYRVTSERQRAVDVAERPVKLGKDKQRVGIAHFYCESALQYTASDGLDRAMTLLKRGAATDRDSVRVFIMMGRMSTAKGEYAKAVESLQCVISQDRELISEALEILQTCYQQLGRIAEWAEFLQRVVEENTGTDARLMLADIIGARDGSEAAQTYIIRQLQRHPTMRIFYKLTDYHLNEAGEGRAKENPVVLRDTVGKKVRSKPRYRCQKCGFTAYTLYWHCPFCRAWSTTRPIHGLDDL